MSPHNNPHRFCFFTISLLFIVSMMCPATIHGQFKSTDIVALEVRGQIEGWTFTVGENWATRYPLELLCGQSVPPREPTPGALPIYSPRLARRDLPAYFDWRDQDGVTPVRNQGQCGSCWAFADVGALEAAIKIVDGTEVDISEQWLISCNLNEWGCGGGYLAFDYFDWQVDACGLVGAVLESDFPYGADDLPCGCGYPRHYRIDSWGVLIEGFEVPPVETIKQALMDYGPLSVSVTVDSAFQAYTGGVFNACSDAFRNHGVVIVGWDDTQGSEGVWFVKNSWTEDWGENGYIRIEYGCSSIGQEAAYVAYSGSYKLAFEYPLGRPHVVVPGQETAFSVAVSEIDGGSAVPGSGQIHCSFNGGAFTTVAMNEVSAGQYETSLPAIACDDQLRWYVSVQDTSGRWYYDPDTLNPYVTEIAIKTFSMLEDDFETDKGWTVFGDATGGHWERGVPLSETVYSPIADYDGSGCCFMTGNAPPPSNVAEGSTNLVSPRFNLAYGDGEISYALWYDDGCGGYPTITGFVLRVYLSNDDGGTWVPVDSVGPDLHHNGGWYEYRLHAGGHLELTTLMRLRFEAYCDDEWTPVEAALDAVSVRVYQCEEYTCGDLNHDSKINLADISKLISYVYLDGATPDPLVAANVNGSSDGKINLADISKMISFVYLEGSDLQCW